MNSLLLTDFYKVGHPFQYPKGTTLVYSNLTARGSRIPEIDKTVFFGLQYFIKEYLIANFNEHFFSRNLEDVVSEYKRIVKTSLGGDLSSYKHIEDLHALGYLPIKIKSLPEGSHVPLRVPYLTIVNTKPEFYWVTNFIESLMSSVLWQPITSATIAFQYRKILDKYAEETGMHPDFVQWQGHDFSFRGLSSLESATISGMAHLLSFRGTDTIPAIMALEKYYNANVEKELVGGSVPATEHSVMCAGGEDDEVETYRRLITEVYPSGIVSIVSDTWDLWKVLDETLPILKKEIMARDGKVVIRPDSGDPVDIVCGFGSQKGVVERLWDVFGGTTTDKGYKLLDEHIGVIYGDSITRERATAICEGLKSKGFASQCVFGIGSFTYQHNTRDTFGMAMKATYTECNGKGIEIFKDPVTDDGLKKSAKGMLCIGKGDEYFLMDQMDKADEENGCLKTVFVDGKLTKDYTLQEIRENIEHM